MIPLAHILRPSTLSEIIGQSHLIDGVIGKMASSGNIVNTIIWGPPGTGKTSIAQALSNDTKSSFYKLNATESSVKEIRTIIEKAKSHKPKQTILFIDEIHRFNKAQQDVLLPAIEEGIVTLFGATTENPKFSVNSTISSRCIILETKPLSKQESVKLISKVQKHYNTIIRFDPKQTLNTLLNRTNGDARKLITILEVCISVLNEKSSDTSISADMIDAVIPTKHLIFDSTGQDHYDLAHCYQEAIQNSDVNSAIYWLAKWLESGEDPAYICRRMLITAFEDCASNPNAIVLAMAAAFTTERTGMPECMIPMSLATCEMAQSDRDKSAYHAIKQAISDVKEGKTIAVPPELRSGTSGYVKMVNKEYFRKEQPKVYGIGKEPGSYIYGPASLSECVTMPADDGYIIYELSEQIATYISVDNKWVKI